MRLAAGVVGSDCISVCALLYLLLLPQSRAEALWIDLRTWTCWRCFVGSVGACSRFLVASLWISGFRVRLIG